jgi:hypothetical protein
MALKRSGLWFSMQGGSLVNLEGIYGWECPRQKEIFFFFGRAAFVVLLYSRTRREKEAIVLCCFIAQGPKGKGRNLALKGRSTGQCYVAFYLFLFIYLRPARVKGLPGWRPPVYTDQT